MTRSGVVVSSKALALAALFLAACGGSKGGGNDAGGTKQLDGFLDTNCASDTDCVSDACNVSTCDVTTKKCVPTPRSCTGDAGCNIDTSNTCQTVSCSLVDGTAVWSGTPTDEGQACSTDSGAAGLCASGACNAIPSCYSPNGTSSLTASCGDDNASDTVSSNDPNDFENNAGSAVISSYACAPNEAGPEVAFAFQLDSSVFTAPASVTVSLKLATIGQDQLGDETFAVAADQTTVDLDLIVLEDSCTGTATCANPSTGSVFQGVTAGTSAERVTFLADPTKTYYFVVDGKDMNQVGPFIVDVESCGACAVTSSTDLACNSSFPVTSTTMGGSTVLTNYTCGGSNLAYAGSEVPFLLRDDSGVARSITATLTGATASTGLLVLSQDQTGDCQGADCIASAVVATDNASTSVSWSTDPQDEFTGAPAFSRNWVVVDTPGTANTSFGLSISCAPFCQLDQNFNALYCDGDGQADGDDVASTDDATTVGAPAQNTQWGMGAACGGLTGLTGPEDIITFTPSVSPHAPTYTYTIELASSSTKDLSLIILDAGVTTDAACNPIAACATFPALSASTANPNASGTLTTNVATGKVVDVSLTATSGHEYLLVVDGKDASGSDFSLTVTGPDKFAGCN